MRPAAPCRFLNGNYYRGEGEPKLDQRSAHFFCKGSESKWLRLGGHVASVTTAHLCVTATTDDPQTEERDSAPTKLISGC